MEKIKINKTELARRTVQANLKENISKDRSLIILAFIVAAVAAFLMVYNNLDKGNLDLYWLDNDRIDAPTLLSKVDDKEAAVKQDRYVRGFVRRFVGYFFVHRDDTKEFAEKALGWLHAHSGYAGQNRSESHLGDLDNYHLMRRENYVLFYPVNDPAALKIRSADDGEAYYVELPGTYVSHGFEGDSYFNAVLKLVIKRVTISGIPNKWGYKNATGLSVEDGVISYVKDINKQKDVTNYPLFLLRHYETNQSQ